CGRPSSSPLSRARFSMVCWRSPSGPQPSGTRPIAARGQDVRGRKNDKPSSRRGEACMKRLLSKPLGAAAGAGLLLAAGNAGAADEVTVQLKWVTQAQFAGYYVAQDKGFYEEAGLDVTIKPGGPDIAPPQVIAAGGADVIVDWMPAALAARERGVPLVNVAQVFDRSGMMLTCSKDTGITSPEDFKGKTLGVWFAGNEYPFLSWMSKLGYSTSGADPDVTVLRQGFNVDPLLQKQADCISTMIYNEYWQIIDAGVPE